MKQFVWPLQRVLDVKTKEEQIRKSELFELIQKLAQAHSELLIQQRILQEMIDKIAGKKPQERIGEQEMFLRHSCSNDKQIERLKNKVSELESQQKQKMAELLRIKRFKGSLEKLYEKAKKEFIFEQEKLEQKELDEAAAVSFSRNKHARATQQENYLHS